MRVVFRTDSSLQIGSGHVMRCLTLAERLRNKGAQVTFVCRDLPGNVNALIEAREGDFFACRFLKENRSKWIGISMQTG